MRTDYFLKDYIFTYYKDNKNNTFKVDIYNRKEKKTYRILDKEIIERLFRRFRKVNK
jgi:hypothetical protein